MKKALLFCVALTLAAAPAFAINPGIDLSATPFCPGVAGSSLDGGALDCATIATDGNLIHVLGGLTPAENILDVAAVDGVVDLGVVGDLNSNATFWNSDASTGCAWPVAPSRTGSSCTAI